jgi:hypothetical protein
VTAEIIQFVPRPSTRGQLLDWASATRSAFRADDLSMGHADTAPYEYLTFNCPRSEEGCAEPAAREPV